jgi:hypothetical protein
MGDSITAAFAACAHCIVEIVEECRGASWSIGGVGDYASSITLPNILKQYNANLTGFSTGSNIAKFPGALRPALRQAPAQAVCATTHSLRFTIVYRQTRWFECGRVRSSCQRLAAAGAEASSGVFGAWGSGATCNSMARRRRIFLIIFESIAHFAAVGFFSILLTPQL